MQELTEMLGFQPYRFYFYMWKFVSPLCMAVLTTASIIQLGHAPRLQCLDQGGGESEGLKPQGSGVTSSQAFNTTGNRDKPLQGDYSVPGPTRGSVHLICNFSATQRERWFYCYHTHGKTGRKLNALVQSF